MASIERVLRDGKVIGYRARWRDDAGSQRKKLLPRKGDAERLLASVTADLLRGSYVDPSAGRVTFRSYADGWLAAQTFDRSTREATELRLRLHAYPVLGDCQLRQLKPSTIQAWLRGLDTLAPTYARVIFANVSSVLAAAVDDEIIARNPCRAASVRRPAVETRKVTPWTAEAVLAVRDKLPERYRIVATLAAGLGLRQGEVFGLSAADVDFLRGKVDVRRQVKMFANGQKVLALPKGRKVRSVPLPAVVRDELAAYLAALPAQPVTLPWDKPDGEPTTVPLVLTSRERGALDRNYFNSKIWKPALIAAGVEPTRDNGCHALRHFFASVLLDAGESIKAVSEYLGHADPGFTLRVYTHLMPASDERTRRAVDAALTVDGESARALNVP